jgi:hypothetical protein
MILKRKKKLSFTQLSVSVSVILAAPSTSPPNRPDVSCQRRSSQQTGGGEPLGGGGGQEMQERKEKWPL